VLQQNLTFQQAEHALIFRIIGSYPRALAMAELPGFGTPGFGLGDVAPPQQSDL
jgi:hypothetical protein